MRFLHISDLHIGKRLKDESLEDDQKYILDQIVSAVDYESPAGILISGDIYDNGTPTVDSVKIFDDFLTKLSTRNIDVFVISGNHDSSERLEFGSKIFEKGRIFISGSYNGTLDKHTVTRDGESVDIYMLPFIKPINVRRAYPDEKIETYNDAVKVALNHTDHSGANKKILMTHQFVSGISKPETSDSEVFFVGGTEAVSPALFDGFDYVALGHLHIPQYVDRETVRYSGSPLKYSLSELRKDKSVTVVEVGDDVSVSTRPLKPLREMRLIKGPLDKLIEAGKKDGHRDDLIYAKLDEDAMDAMQLLREVYPNIISLEVASSDQTELGGDLTDDFDEGLPDPVTVFSDFFKKKNGSEMTENQNRIIRKIMDELEVRL